MRRIPAGKSGQSLLRAYRFSFANVVFTDWRPRVDAVVLGL